MRPHSLDVSPETSAARSAEASLLPFSSGASCTLFRKPRACAVPAAHRRAPKPLDTVRVADILAFLRVVPRQPGGGNRHMMTAGLPDLGTRAVQQGGSG